MSNLLVNRLFVEADRPTMTPVDEDVAGFEAAPLYVHDPIAAYDPVRSEERHTALRRDIRLLGTLLGDELVHVFELPFLQRLPSIFQPQARGEAVPVQIDSDVTLGFHVLSSFFENQAE